LSGVPVTVVFGLSGSARSEVMTSLARAFVLLRES